MRWTEYLGEIMEKKDTKKPNSGSTWAAERILSELTNCYLVKIDNCVELCLLSSLTSNTTFIPQKIVSYKENTFCIANG